MLAQSAAGAGLGMKDVLEGVGSRARRAEGVAKGYPVGQAASPGCDCSPWLPAGIQEAAGIPSSSRGRCCGAENARKCPATAVPALPTSAAHPPAAFLLASACSSPWPWRTELRGDSRSCAGIHGVWSTGKRLLMCSTAHAWLAGRPCPPSPAPHVGKRIGMLRGCSGNARRGCSGSAWGCSRGCSGGTQRMPGGMPRRVWSIQQPNTLLRSRDHLAWGAAGSHRSPGSRLGSEEGTGRQRGSLLPPGTPTAPDGALCCSAAAPAPLPPGELAEGMPTFTLPSSQRPLRLLQARLPGQQAGCAVGRSNNPLLCCWGCSPWSRDPQEQRAVGWACTHGLGAAMGARSLQSRGGAAASSDDVPSGDPRVGVGRNAGYPSPGKAGEASAPRGVKPQAGSPMS